MKGTVQSSVLRSSQPGSVQRVDETMKGTLQKLFVRSLARVALGRVIREKVSCKDGTLQVENELIELARYRRIVCVAIGKAAFRMAEVTADIIHPYSMSGVVCGPETTGRLLHGFACFFGGHPYPNIDSFMAGHAVVGLLHNVTSQDLVIYLLSGGGSALCEKPMFPEIRLSDYQEFYKLLVTCGANIRDVNFVRKHFSAIKGGRLAELAYPARQITIYVSDAPPGNPSNVASGPTMPDESTVGDCYRIIDESGLKPRLPSSVRRVFDEQRILETPKQGEKVFSTSTWHCLLTPEDAVEALSQEARGEGWVVETDLSVADDWPLRTATGHLFSRLEKLRRKNPGRTVAILTGGEYSCPVIGNGNGGIGGRNQAFVLSCVPKIAGRNIAVLSAGTDGIDGTSPAAGAVADGRTLERAARLGLDPAEYARRCNSYGFFSQLSDALMTGPTDNNVRDLRILVGW